MSLREAFIVEANERWQNQANRILGTAFRKAAEAQRAGKRDVAASIIRQAATDLDRTLMMMAQEILQ